MFESDLDTMGPILRQAAMRGVQLAADLGYSLSSLQSSLCTRQFYPNTLHRYNVPNTVKCRTTTKVRFQDVVPSPKMDKPTSAATVSGMELLLMSNYYSVSLTEMQHHLAARSHSNQLVNHI